MRWPARVACRSTIMAWKTSNRLRSNAAKFMAWIMPIRTFDFHLLSRYRKCSPALVLFRPLDGPRSRCRAWRARRSCSHLRRDDMRLASLPGLCALIAAVLIASFNAVPAEARTVCKGSGASAKCHTVKAKKKKFAKRAKVRAVAARARRTARLENPWHGWGGSFHLDGIRYPGGNRSGPAASYNNFEGGFHSAAFWVLTDRSHR